MKKLATTGLVVTVLSALTALVVAQEGEIETSDLDITIVTGSKVKESILKSASVVTG